MPDIRSLNSAVFKPSPSLTDAIAVQEVGGNTLPVTVASLIALAGGGGGGGGVTDGDKGDIVVTGSGTGWTIDNNAVTLAKLAQLPTNRLLGRATAGTGNVEAITIGSGLTLTGTVLSASGGGGGLSAWQTKAASYTAVAGDRLRVDCSGGDVTITLPTTPTSTDADIWIQRIDTSANSLRIDPGSNKFKDQSGKIGLLNNGNIGLIDVISYPNSTIGYLPQHDRITYVNAISGTNLVYVSDGDTNGLFYWLGTLLGTAAWANPSPSALLAGLASSTDLGSINSLSDRASSDFYTSNLPGQWVAWDLKSGHAVEVTKYTIRSRVVPPNNLPRNWVLEGTNTVSGFTIADLNAATWVTIDNRSNDTTLTGSGQYYTLTANGGSSASFRYLRIRMTGIDSDGLNYLALGEIEIYGVYT